jgi:hypothetical protein
VLYHLYGKNRNYFNFYDSLLQAKIFTGEVLPEEYVMWHDRQRVYVNNMKSQLYGEWNGGSKEFYPIENVGEVDKRRGALGLCSLEDYAKMKGMNLPKGYTKLKSKTNASNTIRK